MYVDLRPQPQAATHSPLWHLNATLARPVAALFRTLGVAPGQLSLQSLTLTIVGLLRAAGGDWAHLAQGALVVYAGLIVDRADDLLAERASLSAWGRFLGLVVDRVIDAGLLVAVAWMAVTGSLEGGPLALPWFLVAAGVAAALVLLRPLVQAYADLQLLRVHLAATRRLPGPAAVPRLSQPRARLAVWLDRDLVVLAWLLAMLAGLGQAFVLVVAALQAVLLLEAVVLFWVRRKDPEPYAAVVLTRGPS